MLLSLVLRDGTIILITWMVRGKNGEGNGNPLQCSCLESPGRRNLWAAVCRVLQSQTQLKDLAAAAAAVGGKSTLLWLLWAFWLALYLLKCFVLIDCLPDKTPSFMKAVLGLFGLWSFYMSVLVLVHGGCSIQMKKACMNVSLED